MKSISSERARVNDPDRAEIAWFYFKAVVNMNELNYPVSPLSQSFPVWSVRKTSQPTMIFFYYNLVANSKPQTCARADSFCSKKGSKTFWLILFFPKYATIIRECKYRYIKVKFLGMMEATARALKIILSYQRTITRSKKIKRLMG